MHKTHVHPDLLVIASDPPYLNLNIIHYLGIAVETSGEYTQHLERPWEEVRKKRYGPKKNEESLSTRGTTLWYNVMSVPHHLATKGQTIEDLRLQPGRSPWKSKYNHEGGGPRRAGKPDHIS